MSSRNILHISVLAIAAAVTATAASATRIVNEVRGIPGGLRHHVQAAWDDRVGAGRNVHYPILMTTLPFARPVSM